MTLRIAVVGGGPGGLFFASLVKQADPSAEVTVFERNRPDDTFGFGVVFSDATLAGIHEADPVLLAGLREYGRHWEHIEVRSKGRRIRCAGNGMAAITRRTLLLLLRRRAAEVGVDVRFQSEIRDLAELDGHDVVVAADGANSAIRARLAAELEPWAETAAARFIWFGTTHMFDGLTFVHERGPHGVFAAHAYPISDDASTFIVETDEESWRAAGLDGFDAGRPPGPSDENSRLYLERLFAEQIGGERLLANNSRWASFRTRRTRRWWSGNVVLLGDAAHTAHFSVGSGTKMAMEDAVALAAAVTGKPGDPQAAFADYEAARRPRVERIQNSARPSLSWWERFGTYHDAFEPLPFAFHFLSRSIGLGKLALRDPAFTGEVERDWRATHGTEPLATPLRLDGHTFSGRLVAVREIGGRRIAQAAGDVAGLPLYDTPPPASAGATPYGAPHGAGSPHLSDTEGTAAAPWGRWLAAPGDEGGLPTAREELAAAVASGAALVAVHGGTPLTRVLLAEDSRLVHGVPALVVENGANENGSGESRAGEDRARESHAGEERAKERRADEDRAATLVLSGRADLVATAPADAPPTPAFLGASGGPETLRPLFMPRGVAVVGASREGAKLGAMMARSLAGYAGGPVLVNTRNPDPAAGVYGSVGEAVAARGEPVDLAVLCVPAAVCAAALAEAAEAGVRAALVCAGGFAEAGEEGARLQRDLARVAAETGVRLLGPNTSGFFVPSTGLTASFVPAAARVPSGGVAVVAASGGVNHALAFELANAGTGISLAVGIGAGLDVTAADVLDHLAADPLTTAVALHVETVPEGPRLVEAVRRLSAVKPVVALVVGRSDVGDFARSHTGALATSWRVTRAALRQAGAVLADDEREAVDALTALSRLRLAPAADPGLGIVTAQAGPGLLLVDRIRADGARVPDLTEETGERIGALLPPLTYQRNPVDTGRPAETFPQVLRAVADDPGVDLLAVYALTEPGSVDLADAVEAAGLSAAVAAVGGFETEAREIRARLHEAGIPAFGTAAAVANAVRALVADARARHTVTGSAVTSPVTVAGTGPMDEAEAKDLLDRLGVRTPERRVCAGHAEAREALRELGGPVAVKLLDAEVTHKTEVGGVRLGVRDAGELDEALAALDAAGARRYLVERMAPAGPELVVGARRDPVFGPVVLLGLGGTAAEAISDVAVRLAPLSEAQAARMPDDLAGRRLLDGWRGGPVLDEYRLGALIATLGGLLAASPLLEEIEINPLRLTGQGLIALDAVVVRAKTEAGETRGAGTGEMRDVRTEKTRDAGIRETRDVE